MKERFEKIYERNEWQYGSGEGSLILYTRSYINFLQNFFAENHIKSVVDFGCGDWQFSQYIDWSGIQYYGFDLVESVIDNNKKHYDQPNISFHLFHGEDNELPNADLFIAKDVLQHWSNESIKAFIPTLANYPMSLITNCVNPYGITANIDINEGEFRPLDLRLPPFNLKAIEVHSFSRYIRYWFFPFNKPKWTKKVLLMHSTTFR
jgi:SAM-dependent methyltransferase